MLQTVLFTLLGVALLALAFYDVYASIPRATKRPRTDEREFESRLVADGDKLINRSIFQIIRELESSVSMPLVGRHEAFDVFVG